MRSLEDMRRDITIARKTHIEHEVLAVLFASMLEGYDIALRALELACNDDKQRCLRFPRDFIAQAQEGKP